MPNADEMITLAWRFFCARVAGGLLKPSNEKMMQLQLAQILQSLAPLYESSSNESYKILLEYPVRLNTSTAIIDIVIEHTLAQVVARTAIELKCYRLYSNNSDTRKRGAQNLGMYDYWADIENIEQYCDLQDFDSAFHLTLTDDPYYVEAPHAGAQVSTFSTNKNRSGISGTYKHAVANREGSVTLKGTYSMPWTNIGSFYFIFQRADV